VATLRPVEPEPPAPQPYPPQPPPLADASGTPEGQDATLGSAISCLGRALSLRKIGFFLVGVAGILIVVWLLSYLLQGAREPAAVIILGILILAIAAGLGGVVCGGVAYLAHAERSGARAGFGDAFGFCARYFGPLFATPLLLLLATLIVSIVVNGIVYALRSAQEVGSVIAALLFIPQFCVNLLLVLAQMLSVLAIAAIAVEGVGPVAALGQLLRCLRVRTGHLVATVALTFSFAVMMTLALAVVVFAALMPTLTTNSMGGRSPFDWLGFELRPDPRTRSIAPSGPTPAAMRGDPFGFNFEPDFGRQRRSFDRGDGGGDVLRMIAVALILVALMAYPAVYWIVTLTDFYASGQHLLAPPRRRVYQPPGTY
jgi:hypothetical protein